MSVITELLEKLWDDYTTLNPQAQAIGDLLRSRGEQVPNDHIAFRTFNDPRVGLDAMARVFLDSGYRQNGNYAFTEKKLLARHYEHADPALPKVFISELLLEAFSGEVASTVGSLLDQVPAEMPDAWDFPIAGRPWQITYAQYESLRTHSEYAAWLSAFGFRANHFTIDVGALKTFDSLEDFNTFLEQNGFALNTAGGRIKGSPKDCLEQSSTLAPEVSVDFADGPRAIPGCYYEFARRYTDTDGKLFTGFIAKSADKIFQSTDRRDDEK